MSPHGEWRLLENFSKKGSEKIAVHNEDFLKSHLKSDKGFLDNILKAVDRQGVKPEQILVISFTNKAVGELKEKINKGLKIPCPVTTFHKTGYAILRKQEADKKTIVSEGFLFNVVNEYLKKDVLKEPQMIDKLITFFGSYFSAPYDGDDLNSYFNYLSKSDFTSLRSNIKEYSETIVDSRLGKSMTINYEPLRSREEAIIANFLYLNKIDYEYEKPYPYNFKNSHRAYTPDFTITQDGKTLYLEHFGITEGGTSTFYDELELSRYKAKVNDKILFHRTHKTKLIYTFSSYNDGRPLLEHLREHLTREGIRLEPRDPKEVYEKIVTTEENKYIVKLVRLVCTFIQAFKTNGYNTDKFREFHRKTKNVRTSLFLDICHQCYLEYSKKLKERDAVDFEDMINDSAKILQEQSSLGRRLGFKYIIIDEYQDISRQRFDLSKALSMVCDAKIVAVGDDWQSIYAYAGSDITLFTHFKDIMGYAEQLKITRTYRNSQEVIDVAGGFIQKNVSQIRKSLISPKHIKDPVIIEAYSEYVDKKSGEQPPIGGVNYLKALAVERAIAHILSANEKPASKILLIGRYGFDAFNLSKSGLFSYDPKTDKVCSTKYPDADISFLTAHRAKGLGFDNVIIINALNGVYGFPSKIKDDPVLKLVIRDDHAIEYAEERRLFYVALTRTKNRVYIVVPQWRASRFVSELVRDYPGVVIHGQLNIDRNDTPDLDTLLRCPVCGYPLQIQYKKNIGLKLWICTNEPELCDYMTNDPKGGKLSILKCDNCKDGYLIVKHGNSGPFLGCTNYRNDKTGCCRTMSQNQYEQYIRDNSPEI